VKVKKGENNTRRGGRDTPPVQKKERGGREKNIKGLGARISHSKIEYLINRPEEDDFHREKNREGADFSGKRLYACVSLSTFGKRRVATGTGTALKATRQREPQGG